MSLCSRGGEVRGFLGVDEIELTDPGVGARRGLGEKVSSEKTLASVCATDGDSSVRTCQSSLIFGIDARRAIERGGAANGPRRRCAPWTEGVSLVSRNWTSRSSWILGA